MHLFSCLQIGIFGPWNVSRLLNQSAYSQAISYPWVTLTTQHSSWNPSNIYIYIWWKLKLAISAPANVIVPSGARPPVITMPTTKFDTCFPDLSGYQNFLFPLDAPNDVIQYGWQISFGTSCADTMSSRASTLMWYSVSGCVYLIPGLFPFLIYVIHTSTHIIIQFLYTLFQDGWARWTKWHICI